MPNLLIVNDSPVITAVMQAIVETEPGYHVVAKAASGEEAVNLVRHIHVDIVLMDIHMPGMNGVETSQHLLQIRPKCKVLITTANVSANQSYIFRALQIGAVDFIESPALKHQPGSQVSLNDLRAAGRELLHKLNVIKEVHAVANGTMPVANRVSVSNQSQARPTMPATGSVKQLSAGAKSFTGWLCIGCSTGGPTTLAVLLSALRRPFPHSIIICQHIEPGFSAGLARWLQEETGFHAQEVDRRMFPKPGQVYLAAGGYDLLATKGGFIKPTEKDTASHFHPNIDRFFHSVVEVKGKHACGVVLTGMGSDGARGLASIKAAGGNVCVQDHQTSIIDAMPSAARQAVDLAAGLPPRDIGILLSQGYIRQ